MNAANDTKHQLRVFEEKLHELSAVLRQRDAEIERLRAENARLQTLSLQSDSADLVQHRLRELQLQKTMLASLQSERGAYLEQIEALESRLRDLGADSARVALGHARVVVARAIKRRLARLFRRTQR